MKLNQATDYAFRMVLHMAQLPIGTKVTGNELAKAQNIPERFLLKIMRNLTAAKIMQSFRGVDGGFSLLQSPADITLLSVIEAVEGTMYLQKCFYDVNSCSRGCRGHCSIHYAFDHIQLTLIKELNSINFEMLAAQECSINRHKQKVDNA